MDREKVIKGLEIVWEAFNHMEHELYADYVFDAIALLKAQEPVEPVEEKRRGGYFRCGNCNARVSKVFEDKYCSQCGRPVKWE